MIEAKIKLEIVAPAILLVDPVFGAAGIVGVEKEVVSRCLPGAVSGECTHCRHGVNNSLNIIITTK